MKLFPKKNKGSKKPPNPAVPHTAQESIPMQRMFEDGTCRVRPGYYTRTIAYQDINYQLAQQEDKTAIFEEWCSFLNFFDSSIHFLCVGMAAPAFAYGGDTEEVELPVLTVSTNEEDTVTVTDEDSGALTPEGNLTLVDDYHTSYSDGSGQQFITLVSKSGNTFYLVIDRNSKGENTVHFMNLVDESDLLSLMDDEDAAAYTAEKEAAAQAELERKQAEEEAKKAEEAAASGAEQPKENKVTKYAATFLGVLALVGLAAGGGIYAFMKQKQKKQAEKEALDPDADYTEDKGDFEIPVEDDSDEDAAEDTPDE